jgi:Uma2 family endonuclease
MTFQQSITGWHRIKFTVDHFRFLDRAGVRDGLRQFELLDGDFVHMGKPFKIDTQVFALLEKAGAFRDWRKTELIEGVVYGMNSQMTRHAIVKSRLARELGNIIEAAKLGLEAITEVTVDMRPDSLPEPDIVVAAAQMDDGYVQLPSVRLIIEVSDTTQVRDTKQKAKLYADHGVPEYWVFDLKRSLVLQYWEPRKAGYGQRLETAFGKKVSSKSIGKLAVGTSNLI